MTFSSEKTVAFTGHQNYAGQGDAPLRAVIKRLTGEGFDTFLCGMAAGFDLAAAEAVLETRAVQKALRLVAVVPFAGQERNFPAVDRARYQTLIAAADLVLTLEPNYSHGVYYRRNDFLIAHASHVVAWCERPRSGTGYTVRRARLAARTVENLFFPGFF